jgi:hypothetical protein
MSTKKMRIKGLALLLAIAVLCVGIFSVSAFATEGAIASGEAGEGIAWEISADGTLTKAEIASSDLNTVKAAFSSAPKAGEYTLVIATRSGLGEDVGVKTVTRKVAIG